MLLGNRDKVNCLLELHVTISGPWSQSRFGLGAELIFFSPEHSLRTSSVFLTDCDIWCGKAQSYLLFSAASSVIAKLNLVII